MGEVDSFDCIRKKLDIRLEENQKKHERHKLLYKFKNLSSEANITYDAEYNKIKLDIPIKCNFERVLDIVENNRIYVPKRSEVNDPFEGTVIKTSYGYAGSWYHNIRKELPTRAIDNLNKYRFLSLSSKANRPQMWGYYAGTFTGVCLVFSTQKSFEDYQDILYLDKDDIKEFSEDIHNPSNEDEKLIAWYNLLLKSDDWKNEDEVRIIVKEEKRFINFEKNELIAIILGHNIDKRYENEIVKIANRKSIEIYKTYLDNFKLKIDILPYYFDIDEYTGAGAEYEKALEEWRNNDKNRGRYRLGIDGEMLY